MDSCVAKITLQPNQAPTSKALAAVEKTSSNLRAVFNLGRLDNLLLRGLLLGGNSRGRGSLVIRIVECGEKVGLRKRCVYDYIVECDVQKSIRNQSINRDSQ